MQLHDAGRYQRSIEIVHSMTYFAPETEQHLVAVGLHPGRMCYFAGRSAPMGAVGAAVVAATFYNFSPALVARHIPEAWTLATPAQIIPARFASADAALRRMLGEVAEAPEIAEAAGLARAASEACTPEGRPLYAGHAELDWPGEPLLDLWHGASLLREHRGDGHLVALMEAGLSGIDALITHTAVGVNFTVAMAKRSRGWSEQEWDEAVAALVERGLLVAPTGDGDSGDGNSGGLALTADGEAQRHAVEAATDRLAFAPWALLGEERAARLAEIGRRLTATLIASGLYPPGVFTPASGRNPS